MPALHTYTLMLPASGGQWRQNLCIVRLLILSSGQYRQMNHFLSSVCTQSVSFDIFFHCNFLPCHLNEALIPILSRCHGMPKTKLRIVLPCVLRQTLNAPKKSLKFLETLADSEGSLLRAAGHVGLLVCAVLFL